MSAAEKIAQSPALGWAEIRERYPNEWVLLVDVEHQTHGSIRTARVAGHDPSLKQAVTQVEDWSNDRVVAYSHTGGLKRQPPRIAGKPTCGSSSTPVLH